MFFESENVGALTSFRERNALPNALISRGLGKLQRRYSRSGLLSVVTAFTNVVDGEWQNNGLGRKESLDRHLCARR